MKKLILLSTLFLGCQHGPSTFDWHNNYYWSVIKCDQAKEGSFIDAMYSKGNQIEITTNDGGEEVCKLGIPKSVSWQATTPAKTVAPQGQ